MRLPYYATEHLCCHKHTINTKQSSQKDFFQLFSDAQMDDIMTANSNLQGLPRKAVMKPGFNPQADFKTENWVFMGHLYEVKLKKKTVGSNGWICTK